MPTPYRSAIHRIAISRLVSLVGGEAAFVALLALVYNRTHSPIWASVALIATIGATGIVSPLAGALGDHFDRRRVMICSDLCGAVCFAVLATVNPAWLIIGVAMLAAIVESPFLPASTASMPNLVPDSELAWANAIRARGSNLGRLLGPLVGGLLVAWPGPSAVFVLNAVSFVGSAALVASVQGSFSRLEEREGKHRGLGAGFAFVMNDRVLRTIVLAWSLLLFGVGGILVAEYPLARSFHVGAVGYGLLVAFWGGGSLIGAQLAARLVDQRGELACLIGGTLLMSVALGSVAGWPWFVACLGAMVTGGIANAITNVAEDTLVQRRTPDEVRSRVFAASEAIVLSVLGASFAVGGVVVAQFGPRPFYLATGILGLGTAAMLSTLRQEARAARPAEVVERLAA